MQEVPIEQLFVDQSSVVEHLQKSRLLNSLPDQLLNRLASLFKVKHVPSDTEITGESQEELQIYFLIRGEIASYSNGNLIFKLRRLGDMFGDMSFITEKSCATLEVAETPVYLFSLDINDILNKTDFSVEDTKYLLFQLFTTMLIDKLTMCCTKATAEEPPEKHLARMKQLLFETKKQLKKSNKIKSDFLANINHEIRTPMHGVLGMTNLLLTTDLDDQQKEFANIIEGSATDLLKVINNILDYSKLDSGAVDLQNGPFEVTKVVNKAISDLQSKAEEKNLPVEKSIPKSVPQLLRGDSVRVHQILVNLLSNAIKFTEQGTVSLVVKLVDDLKNHVRLQFSVQDTGIGISEADKTQLFKSFSQVDPSLTRKYGGTGLGLVISKQLVDAMEGQIGFESEKGLGSTFWFTLIFDKQSNRRKCFDGFPSQSRRLMRGSDKLKPLRTDEKRNFRILLIGSNKINQLIVLLILDKLGYAIDIAENSTKAIGLLANRNFDVVLLDALVQDMNAFEITQLIRDKTSKVLNPGVPIIAIASHILDINRSRYLQHGMNDCLAGPISGQNLDTILNRWISIRESDKTEWIENQAEDVEVLDWNTLDQLEKSIGDLSTLINIFLQEITERLKIIKTAITKKDSRELEISAHTLKANCITFGALPMANICLNLEKAGTEGKLEGVEQLVKNLEKMGEKVGTFLEKYLQLKNLQN